MKRIFSIVLILSLVLLLPTFYGCSKEKEEYDLSGLILERISHWENDKQIFHDEYYILDYQGDSENLILPSSAPNGMPILHIGTWAFADCHTLKTVTIPQGIQTIEKRAFYGCENLEKVIIGKDINTISDIEVFSLCNKLSVFEVDKDNTYYYSEGNCLIDRRINSVIYGCKDSVIPEGIESIRDFAFCEIETLKTINIPKSIRSIGCNAFFGNKSLSEIYLHKDIQNIEYAAFSHCPETIIYCEVSQKPDGWDNMWVDREGDKFSPAKVYWGIKLGHGSIT